MQKQKSCIAWTGAAQLNNRPLFPSREFRMIKLQASSLLIIFMVIGDDDDAAIPSVRSPLNSVLWLTDFCFPPYIYISPTYPHCQLPLSSPSPHQLLLTATLLLPLFVAGDLHFAQIIRLLLQLSFLCFILRSLYVSSIHFLVALRFLFLQSSACYLS